MIPSLDERGIAAAAAGRSLVLRRAAHAGRTGGVRAASAGAALEVHDHRPYQPGDDPRHVDWSAAARTDELILRVREDEVSPRLEVVLDASRSMAITPRKAARAREIAAVLCEVAGRQGLAVVALVAGERGARAQGSAAGRLVRECAFEGREELGEALRRAPPPRPCGLRVVISDFLFETPLEALAARLAKGAVGLVLLQLLEPAELEPEPGWGSLLSDVESGERLELELAPEVVAAYRERLRRHQALLAEAAARARAGLFTASSERAIGGLVSGPFHPLFTLAGGGR